MITLKAMKGRALCLLESQRTRSWTVEEPGGVRHRIVVTPGFYRAMSKMLLKMERDGKLKATCDQRPAQAR